MAVGSSNDFDLVVLGAGTGGYTAAFRAAQLGLKVALVDEDKIGGTCLHRGCIPTKALLESAEMMNRARHLKDYGVVFEGEPGVDYAAIAARRDAVVKRMWTGLKSLVDKNKVAWIPGRGRLDGPNRIVVSQPAEDGTPGKGGERILQATDVIIATGSRVKSLPGLEPERHDDRDQRRDPPPGQPPGQHRDRRRRGRRGRVRQLLPRHRNHRHPARVPARDRASRGSRREPAPRAQLHQAGDPGDHERPVRPGRGQVLEEGCQPERRTRRARSPSCSKPS